MAGDLYEKPDAETTQMWNLIQTARWLGVAPWELAEQPNLWYEWGEACMRADFAQQKALMGK